MLAMQPQADTVPPATAEGTKSPSRLQATCLVVLANATSDAAAPDLAAPSRADRAHLEGADRLTFGAPVYILGPLAAGQSVGTVGSVDEALTILLFARTQWLCFGDDGDERPEWTIALDRAASAKFEPATDTVEAARRAFRAFAQAIGALATIGWCANSRSARPALRDPIGVERPLQE